MLNDIHTIHIHTFVALHQM